MKILNRTVLILALSGIFFGCKKSVEKNDKKVNCKISAAIPVPSGNSFQFTYNGDGKLIRMESGASVVTYEYKGNTSTALTLDTGKFRSKKIITLNVAGLAINVKTENDITGTSWFNDAYEYNGEELSRSTHTTSKGSPPEITTYTWFGHNLVSASTTPTIVSYDYYTDKPKQNGDYFQFVQLTQGYEIYRNKNLIKTFYSSIVNYKFAADGNISSLTLTTAGVTSVSLDYQYKCN